jgi:hypothetical protein
MAWTLPPLLPLSRAQTGFYGCIARYHAACNPALCALTFQGIENEDGTTFTAILHHESSEGRHWMKVGTFVAIRPIDESLVEAIKIAAPKFAAVHEGSGFVWRRERTLRDANLNGGRDDG